MKQFLLIFSILLSSAVFGQEELRYENRQFYQGEKEITFNEFRDIIKSSRYKFRFLDLRTLRRLPNNGKYITLASVVLAGAVGLYTWEYIFEPGWLDFSSIIYGAPIGAGVGLLSGIPIIIYDKKRFRKGEYFLIEEKKFKRITKRYNESISGQ
jgi:hypothetical protein